MSVPDPAIGDQIRQARQRARLTQRQLADRLNVDKNTVSNWETGATTPARHLAAIRSVLRATWTAGTDAGDAEATEPTELGDMPSPRLWQLHEDYVAEHLRITEKLLRLGQELKRRYQLLTDLETGGGPHGQQMTLPEEGRRTPGRGKRNLP